MKILIVVSNPREWPLKIPGVTVVGAEEYLTDGRYADLRGLRVFNLCRTYRYQSNGYYVSLLAEARGHKPIPNLTSIQDMKLQSMIRMVSDDMDEMIQTTLSPIQSDKFTLSIYFGKNVTERYDRLSLQLFNLFQVPFLRAQFVRNSKWQLNSITAISAKDIPDGHRDFAVQAATKYFEGKRFGIKKRRPARYNLAILHDPAQPEPPSDDKAIAKFIRAAAALDMEAELIDKDDLGRLVEFDALFIRETTFVNHYTYRFSRRAAAEGLVVIDDPESILKCTNKVYLAELLDRHNILAPKTVIVHDDNLAQVPDLLGLPCILKQPDSAFSLGVKKVDMKEELMTLGREMLEGSDLIVAQEFLPTEFDWRIGIFDRRPLYACQYYMARKHWQIIRREHGNSEPIEGMVKAVPVELAPAGAVRTALKAANLIGDGLYGVDIKQVGRKFYVIEINDNPSIEAGYEDTVLKDSLYRRIMEGFLQRIEDVKEGRERP